MDAVCPSSVWPHDRRSPTHASATARRKRCKAETVQFGSGQPDQSDSVCDIREFADIPRIRFGICKVKLISSFKFTELRHFKKVVLLPLMHRNVAC